MSTVLDRRALVKALAGSAPDALFVSGLGSPSWDLAASGDCERYFYLWGGMGQAAMTGLGLAQAQPQRRVIVLTGDGDMLMGLGTLAPIGASRPANLGILVLDNEAYGETGGQPSATGGTADLVAAALACGVGNAAVCSKISDVSAVVSEKGPVFRLAKIGRENCDLVLPPRDGAFLKDRMRRGLGLE